MKSIYKFSILLLIVTMLLAFPKAALAAGGDSDPIPDQIVFGSNYTLESGDVLDGGLVVLGGNAELQAASQVNGDVVVMGGNLDCAGTINGSVIIFGGRASLGETALVTGDLVTLGGSVERADGAVVQGTVTSDLQQGFNFERGSFPMPVYTSSMQHMPGMWGGLSLLWVPFAVLTMAALAMIITMFWPKHVQRVSETVIAAPLPSGGMGCLTVIVLPVVLLALVITCVGILLVPVIAIAAGLLALLGWTAIGLEIGKRIAKAVHRQWDPAVHAGLGVLLLTLVTSGMDAVAQIFWPLACVSWIIPTVVGLLALGAAVLTRFGTRPYPLDSDPAAMPTILPPAETEFNFGDDSMEEAIPLTSDDPLNDEDPQA